MIDCALELSIIIINYRTSRITVDCLRSLLPEIDGLSVRIVVVDNFSNDDSIEFIDKWISQQPGNFDIKFLKSSMNCGFSGGNNLGINSSKSKYYLLLNSDTIIKSDAIRLLLNTANINKKMGLFTPSLEWPNGQLQESCFQFHSPISEFVDASQTGIFTHLLKKYNVPIQVKSIQSMPDWSSFACVLVRKEVFDDIGLMDDNYFMYFEDAEFCHRAQKAGWKVLNDPSAHVIHLRGGSSPVKENTKLKKRLPRYYYESRTRYFYQMYGWVGLTTANVLWTIGRLISKTRQLLGRKDKAISEKQWLDIWINWLHPLNNYTHPGSTKSK